MNADTYEADLSAAVELAGQFVDLGERDGNMRKWVNDALNNEWHEGLTPEQWVAAALVRIKYGV